MITVKFSSKKTFKPVSRGAQTTSNAPYYCSTDNGMYVVKFLENDGGLKSLINEVISYEIAKVLNLPIPDAALVEIEIPNLEIITNSGNKAIFSKLAFGSKFVENLTIVTSPEQFADCKNQNDLLPIIIFDHLLDNNDRIRNYSNILISNKQIIYIIDNGEVFGNGCLWDKYSCKQRIGEEYQLKDIDNPDCIYNMMIQGAGLLQYVNQCKNRFSKLNSEIIISIIDSVPEEWWYDGEEKQQLKLYLTDRLERIDELFELIIGKLH